MTFIVNNARTLTGPDAWEAGMTHLLPPRLTISDDTLLGNGEAALTRTIEHVYYSDGARMELAQLDSPITYYLLFGVLIFGGWRVLCRKPGPNGSSKLLGNQLPIDHLTHEPFPNPRKKKKGA